MYTSYWKVLVEDTNSKFKQTHAYYSDDNEF